MSSQAGFVTDQAPGDDLIDRIANALPESVRQDYYREMVHLRFLPESDELLRILRAMQFLALLMQQAPEQMAVQREQLGELLTSSLETMQEIRTAQIDYYNLLEARLSKLPEQIAKGIDPDAIAVKISEGIRQHYMTTGLPETALLLGASAATIRVSATKFQAANTELVGSFQGIVAQATREFNAFKGALHSAVSAAEDSMGHIRRSFLVEYRWSVASLTGIALLLGCLIGVWVRIRLEPPCPAPAVIEAPVQAPAPTQAQPSGNKQRNRGR